MRARDLINTDIWKMSEPEVRVKKIRILVGVKKNMESVSVEIKRSKSQDEIKKAITDVISNECHRGKDG